jgi:hypothetical protein
MVFTLWLQEAGEQNEAWIEIGFVAGTHDGWRVFVWTEDITGRFLNLDSFDFFES